MTVFRLSKCKYKTDLSGKGAELVGGRWNSRGTPMLYTSDSRALCTAEIAANTPLGILPSDYCLISIDIPKEIIIADLDAALLSKGWKSFPHSNETQKIGDSFIADEKSAVLKVPSAVVPGDFNFIMNTNHPDFKLIKVAKSEPFEFDKRLF